MGRNRTRLGAVVRLSVAQLRHDRGRTVLVALAIALAVLAVTLLASLGLGILETGEERFDAADRDVWLTGGAPGLTADGGLENPVVDSHRLAADLEARDGVESAVPIAFHAVYAGTEPADLELVAGIGVPGTPALESGDGFARATAHYGDGAYDGPTTDEVVVDARTAERFDLAIGDAIHLGTSPEAALEREFTVVGISAGYSRFLGTATVTVPLGELQRIAGTTGADRAAFVTVAVAESADRDAVRDELREAYPEYEVRTSDEQLRAMVADRAVLLAGGVALVGLAVLAGTLVTVTLLVLVVSRQRATVAAVRAIGLSRGLIAALFGGQGLALGLLGGGLGLLATPLAAAASNRVAASVVGFEGLLRPSPAVYLAGLLVAVGVGTAASLAAGWRASRYARPEHLR